MAKELAMPALAELSAGLIRQRGSCRVFIIILFIPRAAFLSIIIILIIAVIIIHITIVDCGDTAVVRDVIAL